MYKEANLIFYFTHCLLGWVSEGIFPQSRTTEGQASSSQKATQNAVVCTKDGGSSHIQWKVHGKDLVCKTRTEACSQHSKFQLFYQLPWKMTKILPQSCKERCKCSLVQQDSQVRSSQEMVAISEKKKINKLTCLRELPMNLLHCTEILIP